MYESSVVKNITSLLTRRGAWVVKVHGNEVQAGCPDLIVCYRGRFLALEVKGPNGHLRPNQKVRMKTIRRAGGIAESAYGTDCVETLLNAIDNGGRYEPTPIA